jgi:glucose/arabinose dehydrogenase
MPALPPATHKLIARQIIGIAAAGLPLLAAIVWVGMGRAIAQAERQAPGTPAALTENFHAQHEIGHRFLINPGDLPPPNLTKSVGNAPTTIPYSGQTLNAPPGFRATIFAKGLKNPRRMLVLPNGDVLVAEQRPNTLTLLHDDGSGQATAVSRRVEGVDRPYGLALRGDTLLVADQQGIWQILADINTLGSDKSQALGAKLLTRSGVFGEAQGHENRPLLIDAKTGALIVGVGSAGNLDVEPEPKATIQRFDADGSNQSALTTGMRNPTALAFEPHGGELYAIVQERDGLGDDLPSDYLTHVQAGGFYGWPYAYIGKHPQAGFADRAPEKVNETITPDLLFQAHSSALDLLFYEADQFPNRFRGGAFVALRGSWNRSAPTGYKVVFVPFDGGRPSGGYENFVTGFWASGLARAEVWGRPAALAVGKDGALLIADDTGGTIWRISYEGSR